MSAVPIRAIVDLVCARTIKIGQPVHFKKIQDEVERESGGPVGEGYLASTIEDLGYRVSDATLPWLVSR